MKSPARVITSTIAATILLLGGFILGGSYASRRAAYAANTSNLAYLTAIHQSLTAGKPDDARRVAATAIDNHVEALQNIRALRAPFLQYTLPWDRQPEQTTKLILSQTRTYTAKHQNEIRPETQVFLAAQQ